VNPLLLTSCGLEKASKSVVDATPAKCGRQVNIGTKNWVEQKHWILRIQSYPKMLKAVDVNPLICR
jgi:hypothetical protein